MTARLVHISEDLALPRDVATSTLIVYGGKGMGKTNLGAVLVEELAACGIRWAALDPIGVWWGLRHSGDGKGPGIECLILGGPHGDIAIEPTAGAVVADLVADETVNVVIDFSRKPSGEMWSIGEKVRFVTDYALRLFQRQGDTTSGARPALLQILDEAARYIPQTIPSGAPELARSVGAWEQLAEEGRNVSLGVCFITQRSARINKSVAELADAMIAFRTVGPNSVAAVIDWLGEHVERKRISEFIEQLRTLEVGQALVVSPGWLRFEGVVKVRKRETFDSSATRKEGDARAVMKNAAKPDLLKYRARMAATVERASADDPKALRRRIGELEKQLATKGAVAKSVETKLERLEVPVLKDAAIARFEQAAKRLNFEGERLDRWGDALRAIAGEILGALGKAERSSGQRKTVVVVNPPTRASAAPARSVPPPSDRPKVEAEGITPVAQRILDALAELGVLGVAQPERVQVAFLAGYTNLASKGFANAIGALRTAGLIDYPGEGRIALTDRGRDAASWPSAPRSSEELQERVLDMLGGAHARVLRPLIEAYPQAIARQELAAKAGYTNTASKGFANAIGRLRSLGFIDYPESGTVVAQRVLFLEAA